MECKNCRGEIPEGAKVCPFCGTPADAGTSDTQVGYAYGAPDQNQGGYSYGASDQNQGGYSYGASNQDQGGYSYGASDQNQGGYSYGASNQDQGGYSYGASNQDQSGYSYGASEQNQGDYSYGASNQDQGGYSYGAPNQGQGRDFYGTSGQDQGDYSYGAPDQNQGGYFYGTSDYGRGNYTLPPEPISGTPYMVFAILATLLCCLPLGIAAIVYASRINTLQNSGDYAGARAAAKKAKTFTIIGVVIGLVISFIYITFVVIGISTHSIIEPSNDSAYEQPQFTEDDADWETADEEEEEAEEEEVKKPAAEPAPVSSELGASWDTYTVQINEKVLTLPCTMAEMEASGLVLDTEDTPADYIVNGGEYILAYFMDTNDNEIMVDVINLEEGAKTVKECLIGGVSVWDYDLEQGGLTVFFPGGIQIGTPVEELLSKYGDAEDVTENGEYHTYMWYSEDYSSYYIIDIEAETGLVCNMSVEHYGE